MVEDRGSGTEPQVDPEVYRRRWWILVVLCTSLIIVIVGNTALNVALPTLARELDADTTQLQWMVDAYALVFAGMLFTAGALGDRFGRKGALQLGLVVFLGGSLLAASASTAEVVIAGRAVMGLGAAFVMPSTLSILANVFPPYERPKAIAIWAGISGGGAAIGPVASGFLLEHFSWGSVFLVNVPIIVVALVAGKILLPRSKDPTHGQLDPVGAVLSIAGLAALVFTIIEAPSRGWTSTTTLLWFAAAFVLLGLFAWWELRSPHPMLELRWFRDRQFSVASGSMTLVFFAMFGTFFLITQYFQLVLGYSTLQAGLSQLPFAIIIMLVAPQTPKLGARFGAPRIVATGLGLVAIGMLAVGTVGIDSSYPYVLLTMIPLATGMALTMAPLTASIMVAVPTNRAGVGSAMNDTTRELGGALGVAVLGSIVASRYASEVAASVGGLPEQAAATAESGLAGALLVAGRLGEQGADLADAAKEAFLSGLTLATTIGAVVAAVASVLALRLLPPLRYGARPAVSAPSAEDQLVSEAPTRPNVEPAAG